MRNTLLVSAAVGALSLGTAMTSAQAAPAFCAPLSTAGVTSNVENVFWKRVCDRDGDRCHSVWVRGFEDGDRFRERARERVREREELLRRRRGRDRDRD